MGRAGQGRWVGGGRRWEGGTGERRGLVALLDTIEALQGAALRASELETEILPARIADYQPGFLDTLMAAGEVTWVGVEQIGDRNGHIALYLTPSLPLLRLPEMVATTPSGTPSADRAEKIAAFLAAQGASFFS